MKKWVTIFSLFLALGVSGSLLAQAPPETNPDPLEFEVVLLPVYLGDLLIDGAYGSQWKSELSIFNGGETKAEFYPVAMGCQFLCFTAVGEIPSRRTQSQPRTNGSRVGSGPGALIYLRENTADQVGLSLRIRDLSRQAETFGTEIPVIRRDELQTEALYLLTAPRTDQFRQMLRIYQIDAADPVSFRVRLFDPSGVAVGETVMTATGIVESSLSGFPSNPGYTELANLESLLPAGEFGEQGASIIIQPLTPGVRYWAFVSVTHNETQHTTLITPQ